MNPFPFRPVTKNHPAMLQPSLSAALIRVEVRNDGSWRCANCDRMQVTGSAQVWIDDSIHIGDPWEVVIERHRLYNAMLSAWCMRCANQLLPAPAIVRLLRRFTNLFH